jgi:hypothetical protein
VMKNLNQEYLDFRIDHKEYQKNIFQKLNALRLIVNFFYRLNPIKKRSEIKT